MLHYALFVTEKKEGEILSVTGMSAAYANRGGNW